VGWGVTEAFTSEQGRALDTLAGVLDASFYLAGGVAVAVHLGHRRSHDLDLFSPIADPAAFADTIAQTAEHTRIVSRSPGTLVLDVGGVPASAVRYAYPSLHSPERVAPIPFAVASRDDLLAMKLSAIGGRGAARDFWDVHALLQARDYPLEYALDVFKRKYAREDIGHVVRSLAYFADAEAQPLPRGMTRELWATIRSDFTAWVKSA
jgi:hypothetical protein